MLIPPLLSEKISWISVLIMINTFAIWYTMPEVTSGCIATVSTEPDRNFIEMGVDVLNPLEPPRTEMWIWTKWQTFKNRIGLEGNIEMQDL